MKKNFILFFAFFLCSIGLMAQKKSISGIILDTAGESVIGASILEVGTSNGTVSDIDGRFTLSVADDAEIQISYIGYTTQTLKVDGETSFEITLKEDNALLQEVVVTGYGGKTSRAKLTNSIATVDTEILDKGLYADPSQALSGAVPGMKVSLDSGNPNDTPQIVVRGGTNFDGSGTPLVVVDGQLRDSFQDINPQDIESMDILKDAGATAIYGARASNGVILITTKSGKSGRHEISFKANVGLSYINNPYEFLGAEDYITALRTAYANTPWAPTANLTSATPFGTGNTISDATMWNIMGKTADNAYLLEKGWKEMADPLDPSQTIIYKETIPADYNLRSPVTTQDYTVSMSGGNDKGSYYSSIGYNDSPGAPTSTFYKRNSFTLNGSYKVTDWLKTISNANFSRAKYQWLNSAWGTEADYFGRVLSTPPTARFEDEEGNPTLGPSNGDGNQAYVAETYNNDNERIKLTLSQSLEANLAKGLMLRASGSWYYYYTIAESLRDDYETVPGTWVTSHASSSSYARQFAQTYNAVLDYSTHIGDYHNLNAMLGTEYYNNYTNGFSASGQGAPTGDFQDLELTDSSDGLRLIDSNHSEYAILSYFGRLNYDYDEKYLFSGVFRYDGYSSLLGNNRWGFFPGISGGWVFTREEGIKEKLPFLSYGKLRASYGMNGNATGIGAYDLQGSYAANKYNGSNGYLISSLPNPTLRWEKTASSDVALSLGFLDGRLNVDIDYYNRVTIDKYAAFSLPSTTGFSSITNNNGKLRNRGLELQVDANILKTQDFSWDASFNVTYNRNKILELPDNGLERNRQDGTEVYTGRQVTNPTTGELEYEKTFVGGYQEGMEYGTLVGYQFEGIYRSEEEIPGNLVVQSGNYQGKYQYGPDAWDALTDAEKATAIQIVPGDAIWKDINGDGIIDQYDQVEIGNTIPRWYGGFNTTFTWKGLSLYARFDFALDYWVYDDKTPFFMGAMQGTYNTTTDWFNTYSEDNPNAYYPRYVFADQLGTANYYRTSTLFASKGDYLGVRELSLSYQLPANVVKRLSMQSLSLSLTGQNLGYLTKAKTVSPEISSGYPLPRTFAFGVNVTF